MKWNEQLFQTPSYHEAPGFDYRDDVKPFFYDCGTWQGKPVRAFAWIGFPKGNPGKCPGIVLVHGGGGTAFPDWVKLWNERGYAAIAMDNCGGVPCWNESPYGRPRWPRHQFSGPAGWGNFADASLPPAEQWPYQAAASVIAAHSLLRSFPQVDADRIGITGVSWGGVLTCICAGADPRFAFAAPVYGCGFMEPEQLEPQVKAEDAAKWLELWEPSRYLAQAKMPFLWITGTNDFAFPFASTVKSAKLLREKSALALIVRMVHGHGGVSEKPEEIHNFANRITKHATAMDAPEFSVCQPADGRLRIQCRTDWEIKSADLNYTTEGGEWKGRNWQTIPAEITGEDISAALPGNAKSWYFNVFSASGLTFSSMPEIAEE